MRRLVQGRGTGGVESTRYLGKWLLLGVLIGIVAAVGAIVFFRFLELATHFFLGVLVGYTPPAPLGEGDPTRHAIARPWALPLVTALGGLLSGIIVFGLAPEAEGHGTDAAISAIHHKRGMLRARVAPIKLVASAITIGSGGSAGREGPTAQISAAFGSLLGQWLKLDAHDRRILVAAGMGAGIGAIFRAPLGGALMAAEILYIHDIEVEALIPSLIASIVGYSIFGSVEGFDPIFGAQPGLAFEHPLTLVYFAFLGLCCGVVGILYARSFYAISAIFHALRLPRWLKPALGGLLVGLLGLAVHGAVHTGYGWVQISMTDALLTLPLWLVLVLPFAKILATSLTVGSGGSGGIFGPGMVIGGMLGASIWRVGHGALPQMSHSPAPFVIVGMIALFGGIAHAPLAMMLMVGEMTGNLTLLAPAMVAIAISTLVVGDETIYRSQLPNRAASPAHRIRYSFPLLSSLLVRDAMIPMSPCVPPDAAVSTVAARVAGAGSPPIAICDQAGTLLGHVSEAQLQILPPVDWASTPVHAIMIGAAVDVGQDQPLDTALERILEHGLDWVPVVEAGRPLGWLSARGALTTYRTTLGRSVRRARALPEGTRLLEVRVGAGSAMVDHTLRETHFPAQTLVVWITRDGETIFPSATTTVRGGDVVLILAADEREAELRTFLDGGAREG